MGCLKLPYYQEEDLEKSTVHFFGPLGEKRGQQIFCIDYYPGGLTFNTSERSGFTSNKYLYNSKEWQDDLDLDWYDYGARMYDAAIGRWHVNDPMVQEYYSHTPYNYTMNNPTRFLDPDCMLTYNWETGQYEDEVGRTFQSGNDMVKVAEVTSALV